MDRYREDILAAARMLLDKGLVAGTWGNVSIRSAADKLVAVTPSGRSYANLRPEDIVIVDIGGQVRDGRWKPSSELPMHLAIYAARPDIHAIVHTHSVYASACAVARKAIPPIIEDLIQLNGGAVDVAEYALPGTATLAEAAVMALADKQVVLLANHGAVCCGHTLSEAMTASELVEKAAQIFIHANQLGGAVILGDEDIAVMRDFYLSRYRSRQEGKSE